MKLRIFAFLLILLSVFLPSSIEAAYIRLVPPPAIDIVEASNNWWWQFACKIGLYECQEIYVYDVTKIEKIENGTRLYLDLEDIVYVPQDVIAESYIIRLRGAVDILIYTPDGDNWMKPETNLGGWYLNFDFYDYKRNLTQLNALIFMQIGFENVYTTNITLQRAQFWFTNARTYDVTTNALLEMVYSNPITVAPGELAAIYVRFDNVDEFIQAIEGIAYTLLNRFSAPQNIELTVMEIGAVFYIPAEGTQRYIVCSELASTQDCDTSLVPRSGLPYGFAFKVFVQPSLTLYDPVHYIKVVNAATDQILCPSNYATVYENDNLLTEAANLGQCIPLPPNSESVGYILTDPINPYGKCLPGYRNLDNPVNGDTSLVYVWDTNGCETFVGFDCPASISISPSSQQGVVGQTLTYTVNMQNTGTDACQYTLSTQCPTGINCQLSTTSVNLNPGQSTVFNLFATANAPGTYLLTVLATDPDGDTYQGQASAIIQQASCQPSLLANRTSITTKTGVTELVQLSLTNNGNTQCTYNLIVEAPAGINTQLSTTTVTLSPGQTNQNILLSITPQVTGTFNVLVTATAQETLESDTVTIVLNVQENINPPRIILDQTQITMNVGETTTVSGQVRNDGTQTTTYILSVDCPLTLQCSISPTQVTVDPGQTQSFQVTIEALAAGLSEVYIKATGPNGEVDQVLLLVDVQAQEQQPTPTPEPTPTPTVTQPVTQPQVRPIEIFIPTSVAVVVGQETTINIGIKNNENRPVTLNIKVDCPAELECSLETNVVTLDPLDSTTVKLNVVAKESGNYFITVQVSDGETVSGSIRIIAEQPPRELPIPITATTVAIAIVVLIGLLVVLRQLNYI